MLTFAAILPVFGKVVTVGQLMAALSLDFPKPIQVAKPLQSNLVFVVPSTDSERQIVDNVVFAIHASVREAADGLHIERTKADVTAMETARTTAAAAWIRQGLERISNFRVSSRRGASIEDAYFTALAHQDAQVAAFFRGSVKKIDKMFPEYALPSGELLDAVIRRIGIDRLAEISPGESRVYQDDPVGEDVALPQCRDLIDRFCQEMAPVATGAITPEHGKWLDESRRNVVAQWQTAQEVSKLRLRIYSEENSLTFWLDGFSVRGQRVLTASCGVGPGYEYADPADPWNVFSPQELARSVKLGEDSISALQFMIGKGRRPLPDWYLHPEQWEPLDLFVRDVFSTLATTKPGKSLTVALQDSVWATWTQPLARGQTNLDSLIESLRNGSQFECASHNGSIVIRSIDPRAAEEARADRKSMGRFARSLASNGLPSIPESTAFLYNSCTRYSGVAFDWLLYGQIALDADPSLSTQNYGPQMLRALGPISEDQWRTLLSGQTLTVGELGIGKPLTEVLDKWTATEFYSQPNFPDWRKFSRELMPTGVPAYSPVVLTQDSTRLIKYWDKQAEPNWGIPEQALGEHFGWNALHIDLDGPSPKVSGDRAAFEKSYSSRKFRYCARPVIHLKIVLPDGVEMRDTLRTSMQNDAQVLQFNDLKPELKDLIWKTVCDRALALTKAGQTRTNPTPPPASPPKVIPPR